jgi:dihydroorotate dehydrogenase
MIYQILKPLLFRIEPERAHELAAGMLAAAAGTPIAREVISAVFAWDDPILASECLGLRFANPIGLAAGFDKQAVLVEGMGRIGFGHVEVGTVTPRPQSGNPRPRMFRLPEDQALINRLGFNSPGMAAVGVRLERLHALPKRPVIGVNIGKNRDTPLERATEDYLAAFTALAPYADYVVVNISSPNTPGLRALHERHALEELLGTLRNANTHLARPVPILLKVSPDEGSAIRDVIEVGLAMGITGVIATNTTLARDGLRGAAASEVGGLSGRPLAPKSAAIVGEIAAMLNGQIPLIAVGGVSSAEDAYARMRSGASLVQLYTALVYEGPWLIQQIKQGLAKLLRRDNYANLRDAIGSMHA